MKCPPEALKRLENLIDEASRAVLALDDEAPEETWTAVHARYGTLMDAYGGRDSDNFTETVDRWVEVAQEIITKREGYGKAFAAIGLLQSAEIQAWHDTLLEVKALYS